MTSTQVLFKYRVPSRTYCTSTGWGGGVIYFLCFFHCYFFFVVAFLKLNFHLCIYNYNHAINRNVGQILFPWNFTLRKKLDTIISFFILITFYNNLSNNYINVYLGLSDCLLYISFSEVIFSIFYTPIFSIFIITTALKVETELITNIVASPIERTVILVIMYVETFKTGVIVLSVLNVIIIRLTHTYFSH